MNASDRLRRLRFRSWHCGMRELDLLLGQFADANLESLSSEDLAAFEALLAVSNPDLFAWITGATAIPLSFQGPLMTRLLAFLAQGRAKAQGTQLS